MITRQSESAWSVGDVVDTVHDLARITVAEDKAHPGEVRVEYLTERRGTDPIRPDWLPYSDIVLLRLGSGA